MVKGGRVVGQGFHRRAGAPHAEVEAISDAGRRARGASMYVTLEPCNHTGRTPPCTEALLTAGVARLFVGCPDPNPDVAGGGVRRLRRRGVEVVTGVEAEACAEVLRAFTTRVTTGMPLVTLKLAATLDGRIATRNGESRWITGERARRMGHRWRDQMDAIMVGAQTVMADDPELTCRLRGGRDPLRVVVDGRLRIPVTARVLTNDLAAGTLVATAKASGNKLVQMRRNGVQIETLPATNGERFRLRTLLRRLAGRGVSSVLLEGGADLASTALREGVVHRVALFVAPMLVGGDGRPMLGSLGVERLAEAMDLSKVKMRRVGTDFLIEGEVGVVNAS